MGTQILLVSCKPDVVHVLHKPTFAFSLVCLTQKRVIVR
jgi:hypothetical protein